MVSRVLLFLDSARDWRNATFEFKLFRKDVKCFFRFYQISVTARLARRWGEEIASGRSMGGRFAVVKMARG
jgi:hypothetical protein